MQSLPFNQIGTEFTDSSFPRPSALATLVTLFFLSWPLFFLDLAAFSIDFVGGFFLTATETGPYTDTYTAEDEESATGPGRKQRTRQKARRNDFFFFRTARNDQTWLPSSPERW